MFYSQLINKILNLESVQVNCLPSHVYSVLGFNTALYNSKQLVTTGCEHSKDYFTGPVSRSVSEIATVPFYRLVMRTEKFQI